MAEQGYYELQVLDQDGWSLRARYPLTDDDPLVLMRARAEAEAAAEDPEIRAVELFHEYVDPKTNEAKRDSVFARGTVRASQAPTAASTPQTRRKIMRTVAGTGRTGGGRGRPIPAVRPPDEPAAPAAEPAPPRPVAPPPRPWWRQTAVLALGSLGIVGGVAALVWTGLSRQPPGDVPVSDRLAAQAGIATVVLLGGIVAVVWLRRRGLAGLLPARRPRSGGAPEADAPPAVIEMPAPVPPAAPRPRAVDPAEAMVEAQQGRVLRFLRECLLQPGMREAFAADGTLRDPHIVHGCHLFLLGAAEVCVTDTSSGVSDRAHLVRVMKAVMRAIGSPEERAEAFVQRLESYRKQPQEHTMILLGQLAMDHYLQSNQVQDGALTSALMRWSVSPSEA